MKISCILANYNGGVKVSRCAKLCASYCDEIIVVDDCSTDDSIKLLKKINNKKIKIFKNKQNRGASYSRNFGAKKTKFEKLLFIDNDCMFKKDEFEKLLKYNEDIIYPKIIDNGKIYNFTGGYLQNSVCFLIDKQNFKKAGEFDEKIRIYMDDVDFFFRCKKVGLTQRYVSNSNGIHLGNYNNTAVSKKFFLNLKNTTYFVLKNKRFGIVIDEFPNLLTIFLNLRRCIINKDRLYGSKITNNRLRTFFKGFQSIMDGISYFATTYRK